MDSIECAGSDTVLVANTKNRFIKQVRKRLKLKPNQLPVGNINYHIFTTDRDIEKAQAVFGVYFAPVKRNEFDYAVKKQANRDKIPLFYVWYLKGERFLCKPGNVHAIKILPNEKIFSAVKFEDFLKAVGNADTKLQDFIELDIASYKFWERNQAN